MAKWEASAREFYVEQTAVVADALQEALVQDYDGIIRIVPAIRQVGISMAASMFAGKRRSTCRHEKAA